MKKTFPFLILIRILGKQKWLYLLSSLMFVAVIFFRTLEPKVFQWLTDELILFNDKSSKAPFTHILTIPILEYITGHIRSLTSVLLYYSLMYVGVTFVRSLTVFTANAINASSTEITLNRLRNQLFSHLQNISLHHYIHHSKGEMIQRCTNDLEVVKDFIQNNIVEMVRIIFMIIFSVIMVYYINPIFTLVSICLMPFVVLLSFHFYKKEKTVWEDHETESDKLNTIIQENIQGIRTIKAYANEEKSIQQFELQNERRLDAGIKHIELHGKYWPIMNLIVFLQIVLSIFFGIYYSSKGYLSIGELMAGYIFINMMLWPLRQISKILAKFSMAMVALHRIDELLTIPVEEDVEEIDSTTVVKGSIEFKNVSFYYPGKKTAALKNINFHILPGEKVALIGPTGAGKSTIVKLLLRLYEPSSGTILIDNRDIKSYSKPFLRKHMGVALQNSMLFSASIKENLRSVKSHASDLMLKEVLAMAKIDDLLVKSEKGLDCMIGEKGVNLSGGQKQRMALARLMLKSPHAFVLDDVTSYIDEINEQAILESLSKIMHNKTCIIISHKLSSIAFADKVIVLSHGQIEQIGDQYMLANIDGYFNIIHDLQTDKSAVLN